jgi:hypothetical protein
MRWFAWCATLFITLLHIIAVIIHHGGVFAPILWTFDLPLWGGLSVVTFMWARRGEGSI